MNLSLIVLIIWSFLLSCDKQKSPIESASKAPTNSALTELDSRIPPDDPGKYKRNLRPYVVLAIAIQATGFLDLSNHHLVAAGSQGSLTRNILQPVL